MPPFCRIHLPVSVVLSVPLCRLHRCCVLCAEAAPGGRCAPEGPGSVAAQDQQGWAHPVRGRGEFWRIFPYFAISISVLPTAMLPTSWGHVDLDSAYQIVQSFQHQPSAAAAAAARVGSGRGCSSGMTAGQGMGTCRVQGMTSTIKSTKGVAGRQGDRDRDRSRQGQSAMPGGGRAGPSARMAAQLPETHSCWTELQHQECPHVLFGKRCMLSQAMK